MHRSILLGIKGPRNVICVLFFVLTIMYLSLQKTSFWNFARVQGTRQFIVTSWLQRNLPGKHGQSGYSKRRQYLSEGDLRTNWESITLNEVSDPKLSTMYLIAQNSTVFKLNDLIKVRIEMRDKTGKRRKAGGDFLRLWMEEPFYGASVAGDVIDHNDGTYTGSVRAVWTGSPKIHCFLDRRREEIDLMYRKYKQFGTIWDAYALFRSGTSSESTLCFPNTKPPHLYCDFTHDNGGLPYYCLRPVSRDLNCSSWFGLWSHRKFVKLDPRESSIFGLTWNKDYDYLDGVVRVQIKADKEHPDRKFLTTSVPCHSMPPINTWKRHPPIGFFYNNTWIPRLCRMTFNSKSESDFSGCLRNRNLWMSGDSTSIQFIFAMNSVVNLVGNLSRSHTPKSLRHPSKNFTISWAAHEFPYFPGMMKYHRRLLRPPNIHFKTIRDNSRDIIVLYMNLHFTLVHPRVYRQHARVIARATSDLLARAPNVTVAVRGPHAFFRQIYRQIYAYWGLLYHDILLEEFRSVQDRVIYLDYWDMTMALGLSDQHPPVKTVHAMIQYMMSLLCRTPT